MRFILGNLYDFYPNQDLLDYECLLPQDQYFLHLLYEYGDKVRNNLFLCFYMYLW